MEKVFVFLIVFVWAFAFLFSQTRITSENTEDLDFKNKFKPKKHFFYEKCSKCGKRLKHYHWFWGKGDFMGCDVDYNGNTEWFCEKCEEENAKTVLHVIPK